MIKKGNYFLETITRMEKVARIIIIIITEKSKPKTILAN